MFTNWCNTIWQTLVVPVEPFAGGHAGNVLEDAEEGALAGKTRRGINLNNFQVGMLTQEPLNVADTILIDELRKGYATTRSDTVGNIAAVGTQLYCHIGGLQLAVSEKLTLVHELADTLQQVFTTIDGTGFWL